MGYIDSMQTVAETPSFTAQANAILTEEEKKEIIDLLAAEPECGEVIPSTGGIRKVRVALPGRGKRGGARVVYYYLDETIPVYALAIYAKNVQTDLTTEQKKVLAKLAQAIKKEARSKS